MKKTVVLLIAAIALNGCAYLIFKSDRKVVQKYYLPATIQEIECSEPYKAKKIPVLECINGDCRQIGTTYNYKVVVTYSVVTQYYNQQLTYKTTESVNALSPARIGQKVIVKLVCYEDGESEVTEMKLLP